MIASPSSFRPVACTKTTVLHPSTTGYTGLTKNRQVFMNQRKALKRLEARVRIELTNKGFADLELQHCNVMSGLNRAFGRSRFRPVSVRSGVLNGWAVAEEK